MQRTQRLARNIGTTLIAQLLSWGIAFVVTAYVSQYLGASNRGKLGFAASYATIFGLLVSVVSSSVLIRAIARDRARLPQLVSAAVAMRLVLCIGAAILGLAVASLTHLPAQMRLLLVISLVVLIIPQVNDVLSSALTGLEEMPRVNAIQLSDKIISSALLVLAVWRHASLPWILAAGSGSSIVTLALLARTLRPHFIGSVRPLWPDAKYLITTSLPFVTTGVFVAVYGQSDNLLLYRLSGTVAVGWYSLAKQLGGASLFIPGALCSAVLPVLSRLYGEDKPQFDQIVRRSIGYMFLLVVPFAEVMIFAPGPLLRLLHQPHSFDGTIPVLIVLGFAIILWYVSQVAATALIASDRQNVLSRTTGVAAVISVPICAGLIWLTQRALANGAVGAIVSDALIELVMVAFYVRALPKGCVTWHQAGTLAIGIVAALPVVAPLYFWHSGRWSLLTTLPGLAMYLPLCYAMRAIGADDVALMKSALGRKLGVGSDTGEGPSIRPDQPIGRVQGFSPDVDEQVDGVVIRQPMPDISKDSLAVEKL